MTPCVLSVPCHPSFIFGKCDGAGGFVKPWSMKSLQFLGLRPVTPNVNLTHAKRPQAQWRSLLLSLRRSAVHHSQCCDPDEFQFHCFAFPRPQAV